MAAFSSVQNEGVTQSHNEFNQSLYTEDSPHMLQSGGDCSEVVKQNGGAQLTDAINEFCSSDNNYTVRDSGLDTISILNKNIQFTLIETNGSNDKGTLDYELNSCGSSIVSNASDSTSSRKVSCTKLQKMRIKGERKKLEPTSKCALYSNDLNKKSVSVTDEPREDPLKTPSNKVKPHVSNTSTPRSNKERARSREKESVFNSCSKKNSTPLRSSSIENTKPNSLPCSLSPNFKFQRETQRTPPTARSRTPGTPSDDGRWPSIANKATKCGFTAKRCTSASSDTKSSKIQIPTKIDHRCLMPGANVHTTGSRREKQKSVEELREFVSRRDSSCKNGAMVFAISTSRNNATNNLSSSPKRNGYWKPTARTRIYHEMSIQTILTGQDIENAFTGLFCQSVQIDSPELAEKQTQSDVRDIEMDRLRNEIKLLVNTQKELYIKLEEQTEKLMYAEQQIAREREERLSVERELNQNAERVIGILELTQCSSNANNHSDSLMILESQIQISGNELLEKQEEISKLRKLCRHLQSEIERVLTAQECLMQEKVCMEREALELQDFLQHEKTAMCEALNESEFEYKRCKRKLSEKEEEVKVLRDECRHLVRLNEQRRQENKIMQSKYSILLGKYKEFEINQRAAVSDASISLVNLNTRIENLVEQLISTYNISEHNLEDVSFQNEAYMSNISNRAEKNEADGNSSEIENVRSVSPQKNLSFITAVINAIRNATASSVKGSRSISGAFLNVVNEDESDSTEMLDSETEPCLMMDNVLEDVMMPDSHTHNMISSTGKLICQTELPTDFETGSFDSLNSLSQTIANRQKLEMQMNSGSKDFSSHNGKSIETYLDDVTCHGPINDILSVEGPCSAQPFLDQVIEVDNLLTKLLKVLRLIQMDNDICLQQLIIDKNKLQENKEDMLEKVKALQDMNIKLQDDLMDATQELMLKNSDLSNTKLDLQQHRNNIDRLNEDICQLSTLCSRNNSAYSSPQRHVHPENILQSLRIWNERGLFAKADIKSYLINICIENSTNVNETNSIQENNSNMMNSIQELGSPSDAVDNAIEALSRFRNDEGISLIQRLKHDSDSNEKYLKGKFPEDSVRTNSDDHINANLSPL